MRFSLRPVALLLSIAFASTAAHAAPPTAQTLKLPELKFEKYTLPNGLTVITHEDHRLRSSPSTFVITSVH